MIKAIDPNQLLTQMRALQAQASQQPEPQAVPGDAASGKVDFANVMQAAVGQVNTLQQTSNQMKTAFELGEPGVGLADVMIASQKASVAFEATVQVRNKMVEAYQEIMRMSI